MNADKDERTMLAFSSGAPMRWLSLQEIYNQLPNNTKEKISMSHNPESNVSCGQTGNYDPRDYGRIFTYEAQKADSQSQIHTLLEEGRDLLNELSDEIARACRQFEPVLLPIVPEAIGSGEPVVPQPTRSEIGDLLFGRNRALRSLIAELRSINNRSTVAP